MSIIDRFESKFEKTDGCWEWKASIRDTGYGQFYLNGKPEKAHRVSFILYKGEPESSMVCHTCDNRKCVNPDHLFLGSNKDNMIDMSNKYRSPSQRLTEKEYVKIFNRLNEGMSQRKIAKEFGCAQTTISAIKRGEFNVTKSIQHCI